MIRFARPGDRPQLMTLWQEAFGDSEADTAYYFMHRHRDENLLVYEQAGTVAGMLTMLPAVLKAGADHLPIRYVYAVATAMASRRQGISTRLLEHAHAWMKDAGMAASVLAPATQELFDFYARRGYQTTFYLNQVAVALPEDAGMPPGARVTDATVDTYARVRNQAMADSALYVQWDKEALAFVVNGEKNAGSQVLHAETPQGQAVAICQQMGEGHVRVVEMMTLGIDARQALDILHPYIKASAYTLRLPEGAWPGGARAPLGMMLPFADMPVIAGAPNYLGLIKD